MNRWKHELDKTAGSFTEEKNRMMQKIVEKKSKSKSKKAYLRGGMVTLFVALIAIFLYTQIIPSEKEVTASNKYGLQFSTEETPVYKDEKMFSYFKAIFSGQLGGLDETSSVQMLTNVDEQVFEMMILIQALEYRAHQAGFKFNENDYKEKLVEAEKEIAQWNYEDIERYLVENKIPFESFKEDVLIPITAKNKLTDSFLNDHGDIEDIFDITLPAFLEKFEAEIKEVANAMGINYDTKTISDEAASSYEGRVVDLAERSMLVVNGVTEIDGKTLTVEQILEKYDQAFWFEFDDYISVDIGTVVKVYYTDLQAQPVEAVNEPHYATGLSFDVIE